MTRFGLKPAEFWQLRPFEIWWLIEAFAPPKYGSLTEAEAEALYAMLPPDTEIEPDAAG